MAPERNNSENWIIWKKKIEIIHYFNFMLTQAIPFGCEMLFKYICTAMFICLFFNLGWDNRFKSCTCQIERHSSDKMFHMSKFPSLIFFLNYFLIIIKKKKTKKIPSLVLFSTSSVRTQYPTKRQMRQNRTRRTSNPEEEAAHKETCLKRSGSRRAPVLRGSAAAAPAFRGSVCLHRSVSVNTNLPDLHLKVTRSSTCK